MKRLLFSMVIASVFLSSCSGESKSFDPTVVPATVGSATSTFTPIPSATETPLSTFTPTIIPTLTLLPDPNTYECGQNVSKDDCDFIRDEVRLTRYYLINNLGGDILEGVKIIVDNVPSDEQNNGFSWKKGEVPYIYINTGEKIWVQAKDSEFEWQNKSLIGHEFTHFWQYNHGCMIYYLNDPRQSLILEGMATWVGLHVAGITPDDNRFSDAYSDASALSWWQPAEYDWRDWFQSDQVPTAAVKHLVDDNGVMALRTYCDVAKETKNYDKAFQSAFGLSFEDFRIQFMDKVLGSLKDCTVAKCGTGVDNFSDVYKLKHLLDPLRTTPNLIAHFVDQDNQPVDLTHVSMYKLNIGKLSEYAQPFPVQGTFTEALIPGRYVFFFCEPGYPEVQFSGSCMGHQTEIFEVFSDKPTEITFQIPPEIEIRDSKEPNLVVTIKDKDGNLMPDLRLDVCNYDTPVLVCMAGKPEKHTDNHGVFQTSLRPGRYRISLNMESGHHDKYGFNPYYEIRDIKINDNSVTNISYQFPIPNFVVKFTDVNGSGVPNHEFVLCRIENGIGVCATSKHPYGEEYVTNSKGVFEVLIEPGEYFILTCKFTCSYDQFDYKITDIFVESETEVTTVEFPLYKK